MPELDDSAYIIQILMDIGPSMSGGMGPSPITWQELLSYCQATRTNLSRWEFETLRTLSEIFCQKYAEYDDNDAAAPFVYEEFDKAEVSRGIGSVLRSLAARRNKK